MLEVISKSYRGKVADNYNGGHWKQKKSGIEVGIPVIPTRIRMFVVFIDVIKITIDGGKSIKIYDGKQLSKMGKHGVFW